MLRSPTPLIEGKTIYHLATETIQDILLYLPLDEKLHEVGLSSKTLFAPTLFYTIDFARKHFQTEVKRGEYECIWDFLVSSNFQPRYPTSKVPPIWNRLPFSYQTAIYGIILQLDDCGIPPLLHLSHQLPPVRSWRLQNPGRAIEILLKEKNFNPAARNNRALYWSCIKGETAAVKLLLERLENTVDYQEALYHACTSGSPDLLNLLLENPHVDPSADNCRALLKACESSDAKLMTILLEDERVNPNCVDRIISIAVTHGCDVLQTLLNDGRADPAAQNNEGIRVAAKKNLFEEIECLLSDPRVDPKVALPIAAAHGNIDAFYTLMEDSRVNPADFDQSNIVAH
ncbi:hypothetical protein BCR33DRAFT_476168 [Rhizoclosmatium globosum]|uniref:Uncharacterized protein n=1 Tax=Rhizoclosmatium globosum TaxID=329046 RepID=A0A1Y2BPR0_9FUNG|nr:hypothetical protein BCR33DRAFT_476168 [Rhizoclosmatium globosum]|eukprot:ORY36734.1 hypothetical protein BCR33DRAFT_476168 [Rhizoclosmatium globosum]